MKKMRKEHKLSNSVLVSDSPFVFSEAYKSLRTNVDFLFSKKESRVILVTSSIPNEGKTSVSINLAISLAQTGKKVLLIDCDLRKPKVYAYLRIKHSSQLGLSSVLKGDATAEEAIGYIENLNLYVLLAGKAPKESSTLFTSERTYDTIKELSEKFDYIICDTAPISVVSDAAVLNRCCDGVLFVIRQKYTNMRQVKDALSALNAVEANVIGTVLNGYDLADDMTYAYNKYYYYKSYADEEDGEEKK